MKHIMDEGGGHKIADATYRANKKRRVFYVTDVFYRQAKVAATLTGACLTEYITVALAEKMARDFPEERFEQLLREEG